MLAETATLLCVPRSNVGCLALYRVRFNVTKRGIVSVRNSSCKELTVRVGTEQVISNLRQHLAENMTCQLELTEELARRTRSSRRRSRSSNVLSSVIRPVPLMSVTPPALTETIRHVLHTSDYDTHRSLLNSPRTVAFTDRPLISS